MIKKIDSKRLMSMIRPVLKSFGLLIILLLGSAQFAECYLKSGGAIWYFAEESWSPCYTSEPQYEQYIFPGGIEQRYDVYSCWMDPINLSHCDGYGTSSVVSRDCPVPGSYCTDSQLIPVILSLFGTRTSTCTGPTPDYWSETKYYIYKRNECSDGQTRSCYDGPSGTAGVGICQAGTQTCSNNWWGPCSGEVLPQQEICDGLDNNCNGTIDEGLVRDCYDGPAGTAGVSICHSGVQACVNGQWGACWNQVVPEAEKCDGKDHNCNGQVDEGCDTCADQSGQNTTGNPQN